MAASYAGEKLGQRKGKGKGMERERERERGEEGGKKGRQKQEGGPRVFLQLSRLTKAAKQHLRSHLPFLSRM